MTNQYKGKVRISGKEYDCEVIDGERFINGQTVEVFLASLDVETKKDMASVGRKALADEQKNGHLGGLQGLADALHSRRVN